MAGTAFRGWMLPAFLACTLVFANLALDSVPGISTLPRTQAASAVAPPSCLGAHDLLIDHETPTLSGGTYDAVCVLHGSTVTLASGTVWRIGTLYIDTSSAVNADGSAGGRQYGMADCAGFGNGMPAGSPGGAISVLAHTAVILGRISANGGAGANGHDTPCAANSVDPGGTGATGGSVTLKAVDLFLQGTIQATGGDGGPGQPAGNGGAGGSVLIAAAHPSPAAWTPLLSASAGKNPATGTAAPPGTVAVIALSAAAQLQLPPAPSPLTQRIGAAPALLPVQPRATFAAGMQCGAGDLVVPAGTTLQLHGVHSYIHVCIQGTLLVDSRLTLLAHTLLIAPAALITATGVIAQTAPVSPTAPCTATHALPQPGPAGAAGAATFGGPGGAGGKGGGAITLVAQRLLFAGAIVVQGTAGGKGLDGGYGSPSSGDIPPAGGGVGGAGGSVSLIAQELQLTGSFTVRGGSGGPQGRPVNAGPSYSPPLALRGTAGCVRIFSTILRASSSALIIPGTLYYGRTLPIDPVLPVAETGVRYSTATLHSLRAPFLAFWQQHNGLAVFGEPLSEPFIEHGQTVQYFERAELGLHGAQVTISPLGTLLTAGRSFPTVAPFPATATARYFPATGHSLSGRFLTYWQNHGGAQIFGPPISEPLHEPNGDGTGRSYLVQYFRDARMEYHPELAGTPFVVSLGALGREYLQRQGLL